MIQCFVLSQMALGDLLEVLEERFEFIPRVIRFRRISLGRGLELKCHAKVGLFTISDVMGRVFSAFVLISGIPESAILTHVEICTARGTFVSTLYSVVMSMS